ncbi:hypothetical protein OWV82_016743 [Melia azedarach]|uniref:Uncharacterized protein n=1 Tax=Melia azedarach TaxID=155640 RepID=A0ACC1XGN5_MELAZ|nr:hypothetical protein OWV82_016743 [Melia azedarach]
MKLICHIGKWLESTQHIHDLQKKTSVQGDNQLQSNNVWQQKKVKRKGNHQECNLHFLLYIYIYIDKQKQIKRFTYIIESSYSTYYFRLSSSICHPIRPITAVNHATLTALLVINSEAFAYFLFFSAISYQKSRTCDETNHKGPTMNPMDTASLNQFSAKASLSHSNEANSPDLGADFYRDLPDYPHPVHVDSICAQRLPHHQQIPVKTEAMNPARIFCTSFVFSSSTPISLCISLLSSSSNQLPSPLC